MQLLISALVWAGYGRFQYKLLVLCGWALSSNAVEIVSMLFVLPPVTCELRLTDTDTRLFSAVIFAGQFYSLNCTYLCQKGLQTLV